MSVAGRVGAGYGEKGKVGLVLSIIQEDLGGEGFQNAVDPPLYPPQPCALCDLRMNSTGLVTFCSLFHVYLSLL